MNLVFFGPFRHVATVAFHGQGRRSDITVVWIILLVIILLSTIVYSAWVGLSVAIERDWEVSFDFQEDTGAYICDQGDGNSSR